MTLSSVPCPDCRRPRGVEKRGQILGWAPGHVCAKGAVPEPKGTAVSAGAGLAAPVAQRKNSAQRTRCGCGRTHPSKVQARVCARLRDEIAESGARLYHDCIFPLLSIAPKKTGKPETVTVDFVIVDARGPSTWQAIDAKSGTFRSRDWNLRAAAFATSYGFPIREVSS